VVSSDPTRTRVRLSTTELAAAAVVHRHGAGWRDVADDAAGDVAALTHVALVDADGVLDVVLGTTLETISVAPVELVVEVVGLGTAGHLGWVTGEHAVLAVDQQDGTHEYTLTDPALLGYALALVLGVGYRPSPPRRTLTATAGQLDGLGTDLLDPAGDGGTVTDDELTAVLTQWRATWRTSARTLGPAGEASLTTFTVVDAGAQGYYRLLEQDGTVTLEPCAPSDVFDLLHRLTPGLLDDGELS
jgi:hypothetical protein